MTGSMTSIVAREHAADLRRAADRGRILASTSQTKLPAVELRLAHAAEAHVVARLAALDDAPALDGPVLLALIDGEAEAGLSLQDGRVVANPFVSTQAAVALLRLRAASAPRAQMHGQGHGHRDGLSRIRNRFDLRLRARLHDQTRAGF